MSLSFPPSPSVNDTYTVGQRTWTWTGVVWELTGATGLGAIGTEQLLDNAVTSAKIAAGAVGETDIADSAITTAKIAANAVVEVDIANNAVTNSKIANNAVTQTKLASDLSGVTICTSTTRPGSPFTGQSIYETNTALLRTWNGSSWITIGPTTVPAIPTLGLENVLTNEATGSTSYVDLATVGPSVTVTTGTTALVIFGALTTDTGNAGNNAHMSVAISGATTLAASDTWQAFGTEFGGIWQISNGYKFTGLTAGVNTFTAKYKKSGGSSTAEFQKRWLFVVNP